MLYDELVMPSEYICHHGIKGQKWGVRRFQNEDGSLTSAGKQRAGKGILHEPGDATGINRIKKSHMFKANREAYRKDFSDRLKNATDKKAATNKEHVNNFSNFMLSSARRTLGTMAGGGAVYAATLGASIVAGLIGGPAAAVPAASITYSAGLGLVGGISTAQHVVNLVNSIDKAVTISKVAREQREQ